LNLHGPHAYTSPELQFLEDFMAGHSQFKNIMHRKGKQDKIRSNAFAKLGRELPLRRRRSSDPPECLPQACGRTRDGTCQTQSNALIKRSWMRRI
jgi:hypothetical protein